TPCARQAATISISRGTIRMGIRCCQMRPNSKPGWVRRGFKPLHGLEDKGILEPMPPAGSEGQAVRGQLERLLGSRGFASNERLSRFLRFVVARHLEGRDDELKEAVIAIEVFGRRPDYNPKHDAIVRTEAGRLRARLTEYYVGEGKDDELVIELPKGGYI